MIWAGRRRARELEQALDSAARDMDMACWALNKAQGMVGVEDEGEVIDWLGDTKVQLGQARDAARTAVRRGGET